MGKNIYEKLYYNIVMIALICGLGYVFLLGLNTMFGPLSTLDQKINLDQYNLPGYLLRTGIRFFVAMLISIVVAITYATLAAKNLRLRQFLIPLLDVFQSIPVLGYLSFTVAFFVSLAPNNIFGIEVAVIFAIVTAQVWNMIFSVYQSLITVPNDLYEVARIYKLNKWKIFWLIELPFATPGLIWNIILSMAGSWFFVVAQEVIAVGTQSYILPGMGAYISLALQNMDVKAIVSATLAIICLIFLFNELLFKPIVSWSYKFRYEFNVGANSKSNSWLLNYLQQASVVTYVFSLIKIIFSFLLNMQIPKCISNRSAFISLFFEILWWISTAIIAIILYKKIHQICHGNLKLSDVTETIKYGSFTAARIMILLLLCSLIWVPIGIYIGLRPKLAAIVQPITQFLTAMPANLYYPIFVTTIIYYKLNPDIWLSIMLIIGSQWYILYNVIGGAQTIPTELLEAAKIFRIKFIHRLFKIILPAIAPYYMTGMITAAGASWNASIVAEIMTWGGTTLTASGLGSYITQNTNEGNFAHISLGLMVMCAFVVTINRFIWKPLYNYVSIRYRLE